MKKWIQRTAFVTASISLVAASAFQIPLAFAQTKSHPLSAISTNLVNVPPSFFQTDFNKKKTVLSEDTLIIKYKTPLSQAEHRMAGGILLKQFSNLNYAVVKVKEKEHLDKIIQKYQEYSKVEAVSPSALYQPLGLSDPKIGDQYQIDLLQLEKAQKLKGNHSVTIAVIDQGIDMNHPDLKGRLLPGYNAVNPMNQGSPDYHGTHVAGIIAANKDNGIGGYGVNPAAKILPIDVFDRGWGASDYSIAQGILYAVDKGAKIINLSLGSSMPSPLIEEAIQKALEKNIVVVAAAGNTGNDLLNYPAAYEGVISVGSVNHEKKLSTFSSYGTSVDIVAPGEEIYSTIYEYERKSSYRKLSGTSMSAPMVAGTASLLLSKYPKLTPVQVEYILEHTAEDLGEKGFDVKYGNGLVNPLAALQFDIKKLPTMIKKVLSKEEILEKAKKIDVTRKLRINGEMTTPYQENWYQTDVEKGDSLQFILEGASQYDYKLMLHLYSDDEVFDLDVNNVREKSAEGKLLEAPFSGKLAIGVKDVNGSYDDSERKQSKFTLSIEKSTSLPDDESSILKPVDIILPYESDKPFTLIGKEGDEDFYQFGVQEEQVMNIKLSALPGVDSSISVYMADQLYPPDMNQWPEAEREDFLERLTSGKQIMSPAFYANKGGKSMGESLTFTAMPEIKYVIKISNKIDNYYGLYDYYMNMGLMDEKQEPESSLVPYKIRVEGKVLPPDEDMFPLQGLMGEDEKSEQAEMKRAVIAPPESDPMKEYIKSIQEGALPFSMEEEATGYLQRFGDEDWYAVTPSETGIYEFNFLNEKDSLPVMEIYKIKEENQEGKTFTYLNQIGSNVQYGWSNMNVNPTLLTGLKKDETYYIKLVADYYSGNISFDPYVFSSQLLLENPEDAYEDNDQLENIKNLPGTAIEGNFAMPYDQDVFYLESKESKIQGVTLERKQMDAKWKEQYPNELISPFYGMLVILEDTNKNRKVDQEEYARMQVIDRGATNGKTYGSFRVEKNKNYIIITSAYMEGLLPLSLWPYELKLAPVNAMDEDKHSVVKHNIPSKPLALKKDGSGKVYKASGYLNAGVPYGDEDWYELKLDHDSKGKIVFNTGTEVDGTIAIYKNGKLLAAADYYPEGDSEVQYFNLKKGTYHIKVRDSFGNTTLNPYELKVQLQ